MKEKRTYKRFDLIAFLAILGCIGMLLFESIFIFELYNRAPAQVADLLPVQAPPAVSQPPVAITPAVSLPKSTAVEAPVSAPAVKAPVVVPARREPVESIKPVEPVEPTNTPPAEIETAPVISVLLG